MSEKWFLVGASAVLDVIILATFIIKARDGRVRLADSVLLALFVSATAFLVIR